MQEDCAQLIKIGKSLWDKGHGAFASYARDLIKALEKDHDPCFVEIVKCYRKQLGSATYVITADECCNECPNK
ncbi:unnamed protein product [Bursaphelenchus xylophilus]|uniref:(pine wood nematode) hypothetical protein n=1 Tax=Bursaphelenchus xylophilus TaxID=6326 RepID=A0A1I7SX40_BURXY|nr:unnamed protein product [Bursaphelenchus xylophilus]CAG9100156.1 unnamed protein product [Bursaphelenchus xylophilus]